MNKRAHSTKWHANVEVATLTRQVKVTTIPLNNHLGYLCAYVCVPLDEWV
jgi:hypothetical protein